MQNKDEVVAAIHAAFPRVVPPRDLIELNECDCDECERLRKELPGRDWTQLPKEYFDTDFGSLPLLPVEVWTEYCAAWMLNALDHTERARDTHVESILYSFTCPASVAKNEPFCEERWSRCNAEQRNAIRLWLDYLTSQPGFEYLRDDAEDAIARFWSS